MSAETLRRAAALMRERAEAATPGPWTANVLGSEGYDVRSEHVPEKRLHRVRVSRHGWEDWDTDRANAEHVASWHPAVALAVADWLDAEAAVWDALDAHDRKFGTYTPQQGHAVIVARAYLGEAS